MLRGKNSIVTVQRTLYGQTAPTDIVKNLRVTIQPLSLDVDVERPDGVDETAKLACEIADPIQVGDVLKWNGKLWRVRTLLQVDGKGAHKRGLIDSQKMKKPV